MLRPITLAPSNQRAPFHSCHGLSQQRPQFVRPWGESGSCTKKKKKKPRHTLENIWPSFTLLLSTQWSTPWPLLLLKPWATAANWLPGPGRSPHPLPLQRNTRFTVSSRARDGHFPASWAQLIGFRSSLRREGTVLRHLPSSQPRRMLGEKFGACQLCPARTVGGQPLGAAFLRPTPNRSQSH